MKRLQSHNCCVLSTRVSFSFLECLISILGAWRAGGGHAVLCLSRFSHSSLHLFCIFFFFLSLCLCFHTSRPSLTLCFSSHSLSLIHTPKHKRENITGVMRYHRQTFTELNWMLFLPLTRRSQIVSVCSRAVGFSGGVFLGRHFKVEHNKIIKILQKL